MWPTFQDAGPGMAYVEEGITQSHPLPCDILCMYDWDHLIEPRDCVDGLEPLAWEHSPSDLPALSPANLPENAAGFGVTRTETTDPQDQAGAVPARRKQESNAQAQRKSRQKKKVCILCEGSFYCHTADCATTAGLGMLGSVTRGAAPAGRSYS